MNLFDQLRAQMTDYDNRSQEIGDLSLHAVKTCMDTLERTLDLIDNPLAKSQISGAVTFAMAVMSARHMIRAASDDNLKLPAELAFKLVRERLDHDLIGMHKALKTMGRS